MSTYNRMQDEWDCEYDAVQTSREHYTPRYIPRIMPEKVSQPGLVETKKMKILDLTKLPPREFVVQRLGIEKGMLGLLVGTGESCKSWLVQSIAVCVSSGLPLFGKHKVRKGSVAYVDGEQGETQTLTRISRIANGINVTELDIVRSKLSRYKLDGKEVIDTIKAELIKAWTGKELVVIDSLKKISVADENSAEISDVLHMLKEVAEESRAAILVIAHMGKDAGGGKKQTARGHSSIYDSVDVQIDVAKREDTIFVSCAKNRNGKRFDGLSYQVVDVGADIIGQNCTAGITLRLVDDDVTPEQIPLFDRIMDIIQKQPGIKQGDIYAKVGGDRSIFAAELGKALNTEEIELRIGSHGAKNYYPKSKN